jgi:hypothetical protein
VRPGVGPAPGQYVHEHVHAPQRGIGL